MTSLSFGLGIMPDSHSTVAVVGGTLGPHRPVCVPARSLTSRGEEAQAWLAHSRSFTMLKLASRFSHSLCSWDCS